MAGEPHPPDPEDSGWLQQSLRLLRDSICSGTQPQPFARCRGRRSAGTRGGRREGNRSERHQSGKLWTRSRAARGSCARWCDESWMRRDLEHLRFSSIEPQDVTEDFVALVASSARLAPHFHVPLQSGSDRILRAMHRWYRSELYAERIRVIRRLLPDAAIGADVIVGFPGETDEDFQATVRFHRAPAVHLPARVLVFDAAGNGGREARRRRASAGDSRARPRLAGALEPEGGGFPGIPGGAVDARAHAGSQRRGLDRGLDGKLSESARGGPICRRMNGTKSACRTEGRTGFRAAERFSPRKSLGRERGCRCG